jgi:hypothetical protein
MNIVIFGAGAAYRRADRPTGGTRTPANSTAERAFRCGDERAGHLVDGKPPPGIELGAMYDGQIDVHGLGFSCDGQYLNVIDVATNAVHVIDTATNAVVHTSSWAAPRTKVLLRRRKPTVGGGTRSGYCRVIDWRNNRVVDRIVSEDGPLTGSDRHMITPRGATALCPMSRRPR